MKKDFFYELTLDDKLGHFSAIFLPTGAKLKASAVGKERFPEALREGRAKLLIWYRVDSLENGRWRILEAINSVSQFPLRKIGSAL